MILKNGIANTWKVKFHSVTKPNLLRKIITVYSENYGQSIFCEQKEELFKLKEGGIYRVFTKEWRGFKINKKFISHLTRAKRTPSAAATVQVSNALPAVRFSCLMRGRGDSFQDGVAAGKGFLCAPF